MPLRDWFRLRRGTVEEAKQVAQPGPTNVARAGYEFGVPQSGLNEWNQSIGSSGGVDRRSQLAQLYESFLACPWSWACVNAISRTITAGPLQFDWDTDTGEGDQEQPDKPPEVLACERLLAYCNPREDIRQLMRGTIADLLVFGDAFLEVVWRAGFPVALYSLDAPSVSPIADQHGAITGYTQITEFGQRATFEPHEVIHISLDSPRSGIFGVSPTQAALLPITSWLFTAATLKEIFRKGNPPNLWVDLPQSYSQTDTNRWNHQHATRNIGPRNIGNPLITRGGAKVAELQHKRIEELLHTLDQRRDETMACYGCPPAMVGVIESGNIGAGTGESQRKMFQINTCQPIASLLLEKLDFHLVKRGFGITGWHLRFAEVDMRDSEVIEKIRDMRLRNGAWTLDRYRTEIGEPPVDGGDVPVLVDRQNLVLWRDMDAFSKSLVAKNVKDTGVEMQDPGGADTPVALTKAPPPPPPPVLPPPPLPPPSQPPSGQPPPGREESITRGVWAHYQARVRQALAQLPDVTEVSAGEQPEPGRQPAGTSA